MKNESREYKEAIRYLYSLQKYGIKFGLSKTSNLLRAFGHPQKGQRFIHIAGTNGKGSVAAMLATVLKEAGLKVGLYTSPHLVRFTERFKINDQEILPKDVADLTCQLRQVVIPEEPPTFFEATTAMAFVYFARQETDVAVMEVGMGGRLDATNVLHPMISLITNISLEHRAFLGSRLLDIAKEKAGIIKRGVDLVTAATQPSVVGLFKSVCEAKKSSLWRVGKDIRYRMTQSGLNYYGLKRGLNHLQLGLVGKFQGRNAALALGALERLEEKGIRVSDSEIRRGLMNTRWAGRMHLIARDPLILLDGAHNPGAARALAKAVRQGFRFERLILVIGVMADKEIGAILRGIVPLSDYVIYTRPAYYRAANPETLKLEAEHCQKPGEVVQELGEALDRARAAAGPRDMILVCGSLFTVGEAMTYFDPEKYRPDDL